MARKKGPTPLRKKGSGPAPARGTSESSKASVRAMSQGLESPKIQDPTKMANRVANNAPEPTEHSSQLLDEADAIVDTQHSSHYSLRTRTTQNKNPARSVGLSKRTREEITTEVTAKKAKRQAQEDAKAAVKEQAEQRRAAYVRQLAALEDERAEYESTELDLFAQTLEGGDTTANPQDVAQHRVLQANEDVHSASETGFELADMAVEEIEEMVTVTAPAKKTLSAAEKRAALRQSTLGDISSRRIRHDSSTATTSSTGKASKAVTPAMIPQALPVRTRTVATPYPKTKTTSSKNVSGDAFSISWRHKLQQTLREDNTPSTPARQAPRLRKAPATDPTATEEESVVGGLRDEDVEADRDVVIRAATNGARAAAKQLGIKMSSRGFAESDDEFDKLRSGTPSPTKSATGPSKKKDKSFSALPDYVKPVIKSKVIPSLLEYYGTRENVWDADATAPDEFLDVLKDVLNTIFPRKTLAPKKSDAVYKLCRQRFYDWHHDVQRNANDVVRDAILQRQNNSELSQLERSENGIIEWLQDELDSGAAYYGQPKTNNSPARDIFQSKYILKTLAFHLIRISGSVMPDSGYPRGALALCSAAVQRAFEYYLHEKPYGIDQKDFSAKEAATLTTEWLEDNVSWAMAKESRFEIIIDAAMGFMKDVRVAKKVSVANSSRRAGGAPQLYEPPSSP